MYKDNQNRLQFNPIKELPYFIVHSGTRHPKAFVGREGKVWEGYIFHLITQNTLTPLHSCHTHHSTSSSQPIAIFFTLKIYPQPLANAQPSFFLTLSSISRKSRFRRSIVLGELHFSLLFSLG